MLQTIAGIFAIITSTICLFPQIYKILKNKSAHDVSMPMLWLFLGSSVSWISYGSYTMDWAVLITNIIAGIHFFNVSLDGILINSPDMIYYYNYNLDFFFFI